VALAVAAPRHRSMFKDDVADEDGIHFRTSDGSPVEVALRLDDAPLPHAQMMMGASGAAPAGPPPWRIDPGDTRLTVSFPQVPPPPDGGELRAALLFVHRPPPPVATMAEKTRESLRALGYIE
jgi:hypothetical protein